jgi:uncharacterized membrane protein YdfJ with MMPL/SSD domain
VRITRHPAIILVTGLVIFGALAVVSLGYKGAGFGGETNAPAHSDSAAGQTWLTKVLPAQHGQPHQRHLQAEAACLGGWGRAGPRQPGTVQQPAVHRDHRAARPDRVGADPGAVRRCHDQDPGRSADPDARRGRALAATGTTVTSAGLVLAGTFGVFALVGARTSGGSQFVNLAVGLALGILMDTFLVRTLLVPPTVLLFGRWKWWPSRMGRKSGGGPAGGQREPELPR